MAGANGLTLTTTMSIRPMPCASSSSSWAGTSRRARMPGVDRVVEGLDLAADVRLALGQRRRPSRPRRPRAARARASRRSRTTSTPSSSRSRASAAIHPGSPLTAGLAPGASSDSRGLATRQRGGPSGPRTVATAPHRSGRVYRLTWHTPGAHPHAITRSTGDARSLGLPLPRRSTATNFPDIFHPTWIAGAGPAGRPDHPLQRPDAGAPPPPAVPRDVGVAVVDRA